MSFPSTDSGFEELTGFHAASLGDLAAVAPDELDSALNEGSLDPRTLYYRWERQQWEADALDFDDDRADWTERLDADARRSVLAMLSLCQIRGGRAEDLIVPFVDAVPTEEQQVFMTTQLVDGGRRSVFFGRFFGEVVHRRGQGRPGETDGPGTSNGVVDELVDRILVRADEVRTTREVTDGMLVGLMLNSVVLEGVVTTTAERLLVEDLQRADHLVGLRSGLAALVRDQCRHLHFATGFLGRYTDPKDGRAELLQDELSEAIPLVERAFEAAGRESLDFASLGLRGSDLLATAMDGLARRAQDLGLDLPT